VLILHCIQFIKLVGFIYQLKYVYMKEYKVAYLAIPPVIGLVLVGLA